MNLSTNNFHLFFLRFFFSLLCILSAELLFPFAFATGDIFDESKINPMHVRYHHKLDIYIQRLMSSQFAWCFYECLKNSSENTLKMYTKTQFSKKRSILIVDTKKGKSLAQKLMWFALDYVCMRSNFGNFLGVWWSFLESHGNVERPWSQRQLERCFKSQQNKKEILWQHPFYQW